MFLSLPLWPLQMLPLTYSLVNSPTRTPVHTCPACECVSVCGVISNVRECVLIPLGRLVARITFAQTHMVRLVHSQYTHTHTDLVDIDLSTVNPAPLPDLVCKCILS